MAVASTRGAMPSIRQPRSMVVMASTPPPKRPAPGPAPGPAGKPPGPPAPVPTPQRKEMNYIFEDDDLGLSLTNLTRNSPPPTNPYRGPRASPQQPQLFQQGYYNNNSRGGGYRQGGYMNNNRFSPTINRFPLEFLEDEFLDVEEEEEEEEEERPPEKREVLGKPLLINREITATEVRLIGVNKEQLGVKKFEEAMAAAKEAAVDLVLVNDSQDPVICQLVKWSKYKFEMEKTKAKAEAKQKLQETKELRLTPKTDVADLNVKISQAQKFISKGNKVKLSMRLSGRELQFKEQGKEVLLKFIEQIGESANVEGTMNFKGSTFSVLLVPK